jgi:biotin transport system substrate-specific component
LDRQGIISVKSLTRIPLAVAALAISALTSFTLPATEVPYTLQTLGVMLIAILLTPAETLAAIGVYLGLGFLGVPIFARGVGGISVLMGPTGGFLIGFLLMGLIISLSGRLFNYKVLPLCIGLVLGNLLNYVCGCAWFCLVYLAGKNGGTLPSGALGIALANTIIPYIIPDLIKAAIAVALGIKLRPLVNKSIPNTK